MGEDCAHWLVRREELGFAPMRMRIVGKPFEKGKNMAGEAGFEPTRRGFLKAAGASVFTLAAAAGAFGLSGCSSSEASSGEAVSEAAGIGHVNENLYYDVFPQATRMLPVLDVPTDMDRRGTVAFENREIGESEIARTEECDVLVIGAGLTGSCAALSASDEGVGKVICIEKMNVGRGIFEDFGVVGGKVMEEAGNVVDHAEMADRMYHAAYYRVPAQPIRTWVERSGEAADWLQEKFDEGDIGIHEVFEGVNPNSHNFEVPQTPINFECDNFTELAKSNPGGAGLFIVRDLANTISRRENIDLRFNTPAVKLERNDEGRVTGAIAKDADGYFRINAKGGVVMATGGYDANPDMLKAWCRPEDIANSASWCPTLGTTGDGHLMGLAIGAQMDPIPHAVMNFCSGSPVGAYRDGANTVMGSGIIVNEQGLRFCSESLPLQARGNAVAAQAHYGANCWSICGTNSLGDQADFVAETIQPYIEQGWAAASDTLEGLAEAINVPADTLKATVERYNAFLANGKDEDFNRPFTERNLPIEDGPFYAVLHRQRILATVSGLVVNGDCQVLDTDNNVIPGLYAGGNASGGMFAINYPRHIAGPSVGRCVTFGYISGQNAAREA